MQLLTSLRYLGFLKYFFEDFAYSMLEALPSIPRVFLRAVDRTALNAQGFCMSVEVMKVVTLLKMSLTPLQHPTKSMGTLCPSVSLLSPVVVKFVDAPRQSVFVGARCSSEES